MVKAWPKHAENRPILAIMLKTGPMLSPCLAIKHGEISQGVYSHVFNSFGIKTIEFYVVVAMRHILDA